MKTFKPDRNSDKKRRFGNQSFSGRGEGRSDFRFGGGSSSERSTMHKATCSRCGSSCEVPFKPSLNKPILCSNCFRKPEGSSNRFSGSSERSSRYDNDRSPERHSVRREPLAIAPRNNDAINKQLESINAKLDKVLQRLDLLIDGDDDD